MTLLVRPRDMAREIWDGPRAGLEVRTFFSLFFCLVSIKADLFFHSFLV